ncbi:MAG: glycosyltransferase family 2 protein [Flavobacteriales bacterium]
MKPLRITVITPSYQQAPYLEECLRSVAEQDHPDVEHIVVDGGSTDGSVAILERHAHRLAWWCSERDGGQSDALNKGLAHATGDLFGWINSDDLLLPGVLREVAAIFAADPTVMVVTGRRLKRHADGGEEAMPLESTTDHRAWFVHPQIAQQATFIRMDVVRAVGGVDPALHYVMDLELWWRILFQYGTAGVRVVDREWAVFRMHDESKSTTGAPGFVQETGALLERACAAVGESDLAELLAMVVEERPALRGLPVAPQHLEQVSAMAVHHLLKWYGGCYDLRQYRMMRRFHAQSTRWIPLMDATDRARLAALNELMRGSNWWTFLLQRKWKQWIRSR